MIGAHFLRGAGGQRRGAAAGVHQGPRHEGGAHRHVGRPDTLGSLSDHMYQPEADKGAFSIEKSSSTLFYRWSHCISLKQIKEFVGSMLAAALVPVVIGFMTTASQQWSTSAALQSQARLHWSAVSACRIRSGSCSGAWWRRPTSHLRPSAGRCWSHPSASICGG